MALNRLRRLQIFLGLLRINSFVKLKTATSHNNLKKKRKKIKLNKMK